MSLLPLQMEEMNQVFDVVDSLEISREAIEVELLPAGDGRIERLENGKVRIILPESSNLEGWMPHLRDRLLEIASDLVEQG